MDMEELLQAVNELITAGSPEEAQAALARHPELLEETNIRALSGVAEVARAQGEAEMAEVLEQCRRHVGGDDAGHRRCHVIRAGANRDRAGVA